MRCSAGVTHVVESAAGVAELDDLHGGFQAVEPLVLEAAVACGLQALLEVRAAAVLEAEEADTGLVQVVDERDVEVGHVGAEAEVDVGQGGGVRSVNADRTTTGGPLGAVGDVGGFVDIAACGMSVERARVIMQSNASSMGIEWKETSNLYHEGTHKGRSTGWLAPRKNHHAT